MNRATHFKRYRMERPLVGLLEPLPLAPGYWPIPWHARLSELHADVLAASFRDDLDGKLFPNLADRLGCRELMAAITSRRGFCPAATWLLGGPGGYCGSVQAIIDKKRTGAIQNLGIVPEAREKGLGSALLILAMRGLAQAGAKRCALEVTKENPRAVEMYLRRGFRRTRVFYRPRPVEPSAVGI